MSVCGGRLTASTARSSGTASRNARSIPFFTCSDATSRLAPGRVSQTFSCATPSSTPTSSAAAPERSRYGASSASLAATRDFRSAMRRPCVGRISAMCFPPGALPPDIPDDLRPISGGAGGEDTILTSADGATFRAFVAKASQGDAGVVIAPDVRGLHSFYEALAERFASAGIHAIAFDYFGRSAGTARRPDDFAFQEHATAARSRPDLIQSDVAASAAELRRRTGARRVFVLGFCMGGRVAFNAAAEQDGLAGVVGFYGVTRARDEKDQDAPIARVDRMRAPILCLFGGADP